MTVRTAPGRPLPPPPAGAADLILNALAEPVFVLDREDRITFVNPAAEQFFRASATALVGGLFVVEALSVIIQVLYYKRTGKRVFLMAPIHHHYEKKGWAEPQIVIRFWIISLILAMIGLATLKVR